MDFKDAIMAIAERVLKIRENVANEEATKKEPQIFRLALVYFTIVLPCEFHLLRYSL